MLAVMSGGHFKQKMGGGGSKIVCQQLLQLRCGLRHLLPPQSWANLQQVPNIVLDGLLIHTVLSDSLAMAS
jgi:hypothetical protein